jgi:hypothetical protein
MIPELPKTLVSDNPDILFCKNSGLVLITGNTYSNTYDAVGNWWVSNGKTHIDNCRYTAGIANTKDKNLAQFVGACAEIAYGAFHDLPPEIGRSEGGLKYDFVHLDGTTVDIKATFKLQNGIWITSHNANGRPNILDADYYVAAYVKDYREHCVCAVRLIGYISGENVRKIKTVQSPAGSHYVKIVPFYQLKLYQSFLDHADWIDDNNDYALENIIDVL